MFFLGFILGIIVGGFLAIKIIQWGFYYIGKHPELLDKVIDNSLKELLKDTMDRAENKINIFR